MNHNGEKDKNIQSVVVATSVGKTGMPDPELLIPEADIRSTIPDPTQNEYHSYIINIKQLTKCFGQRSEGNP